MSIKGRLQAFDTAVATKIQHKTPCEDCPFARGSVPGWLGGMTVHEWIAAVHGECLIDCHRTKDKQCAGAAIYRANVFKVPRDKAQLRLSSDRVRVFSSPSEFLAHHGDEREGNE